MGVGNLLCADYAVRACCAVRFALAVGGIGVRVQMTWMPAVRRWGVRVVPLCATLVTVALFVSLGQWQAEKARVRQAEREQFALRTQRAVQELGAARVDPSQWQDMPVRVSGYFELQSQFFVDNRQEQGVAGLHVVTPLRLEGSDTRVLVNRGWVPWPNGARQQLPVVPAPQGLVRVQGIAATPVNKDFWLMADHPESLPRLWPRLDLVRFTAEQRYPVQSVVVLQTGADEGPALVRRWPAPEDRVARHRSYALQWFGMAIVVVVFYLFSLWRSAKNNESP